MRILSFDTFLKDQQLAARLHAETGMPYNEALREILRTRADKQEEREHTELPVGTTYTSQLLETMDKMAQARMGRVPRKDMPQLKAHAVQTDSSIPTGEVEFLAPGKLKKTQEKINKTKAKGIADQWEKTGKKPVLISKDNWILDGHHRVAAAESLGKLVRVVRVDLPGRTALQKLKDR